MFLEQMFEEVQSAVVDGAGEIWLFFVDGEMCVFLCEKRRSIKMCSNLCDYLKIWKILAPGQLSLWKRMRVGISLLEPMHPSLILVARYALFFPDLTGKTDTRVGCKTQRMIRSRPFHIMAREISSFALFAPLSIHSEYVYSNNHSGV